MHVGEPEIPPLEPVREPPVVDAQTVQDRRLQIVDVDRILDDVVGQVVGLPNDGPPRIPPPASHIVKHRGWWSRP